MPISREDSVRIRFIGRLEDGTIFDTSDRVVAEQTGLLDDDPGRDFKPLKIDLSDSKVIEGLADALVGMEEGEETDIVVSPEKAYGEWTEDRTAEYDRETFEEQLGDPERGMPIESDTGLPGEVTQIDEESVTVDFNHELAGETLHFEIEILSVD